MVFKSGCSVIAGTLHAPASAPLPRTATPRPPRSLRQTTRAMPTLSLTLPRTRMVAPVVAELLAGAVMSRVGSTRSVRERYLRASSAERSLSVCNAVESSSVPPPQAAIRAQAINSVSRNELRFK